MVRAIDEGACASSKVRARVTVRVKGEGLGLRLALWYGKWAHARCGRRKREGCVLSVLRTGPL